MMGGGTSSKLSAPVVTWNEGSSQFEWEAVANADTYTVKVNDEAEYTTNFFFAFADKLEAILNYLGFSTSIADNL